MYNVTLSNISWNLHLFLWKKGKTKSSLVAQMVKNPPAMQEISPCVRKIPRRKEGLPIPVFLPGKSHGREPGRLQSMGSQSQTRLLPVFTSWDSHEKMTTNLAEIDPLTDLEVRNLNWDWQNHDPSEGSRRESFLASSSFWKFLEFLGLRQHHSSLCLCHHMASSLCVCDYSLFSSLIGTCHWL